MSELDVNEIISELIDIRRRSGSRLSKNEVTRVRDLLVSARKMTGWSAKEIEEATAGEWKAAAIKPYISHVKPEMDSTGPRPELALLGEMAKHGIDVKMVKETISAKKILDVADLRLEDVSDLIKEIRSAGMSIQDFVSTVKQVKSSEIPIVDLGRVFSYRKKLDAMGIDTIMLGKLFETINKHGGIENTEELLRAHGQIKVVKEELEGLQKTTEQARTTLNSMKSETEALTEKVKPLRGSLDLYEQLSKKGFNEDILQKIQDSSGKYGDPAGVLQAINQIGSLFNLTLETEKKRSEYSTVESEFTKLRGQYQHFAEMITICEKLLQLNFTIEVVRQIYDSAQQYGEPMEVLKAIDKYGRLPETVTESLSNKREKERALERITQLEGQLRDYDEMKRHRDEAQNSLSTLEEKSIKLIDELGQELEKPPDVRTYRKQLVDSGLAGRMEEIIESIVTKRVIAAQNKELITIFRNEVNKQLNDYGDIWPSTRLGTKTEEKVKKLLEKAIANPFVALKGKWFIRCTTCGEFGSHTLTLDTYGIQRLLMRKELQVPASDFMVYSKGRHSVHVTLADIVKLYLEESER